MSRIIPESKYYSGQGRVIIGERDANGKLTAAWQVGNCTALEIQVAVEKIEHKESMTGDRAVDKVLITEKNATFNVTMESLDLRNLALAFWGSVMENATGTVTGQTRTVKRGEVVTLDHVGVADLTITTGSTPTPLPAAEYEFDPVFGTIYIAADAASVPEGTGVEITVGYKYASSETLHALTQATQPERFVRFEGLNTLDGSAVLVEIPRAAFEPLQSLPLINEEFANVQMNGNILQDTKITTGSKYYRQTYLAADWESTITP